LKDELLAKRTRNSKTFFLGKAPDGRERYAWHGTIGAIHYRDNPKAEASPWLDIDTAIDAQGKVRTAPYDLDVYLTGMAGFHYKSKDSGEFDIRLSKAREGPGGRKVIRPDMQVKPIIEGNTVRWPNLYPDTDVVLEAQNDRVILKRILKSNKAPLEYEVTVQELAEGVAQLRPVRPAVDANGQMLKMEESAIAGGRTERLKLEAVEGELQPIAYPIEDDTEVNEQVGASSDDYSIFFELNTNYVYMGNYASGPILYSHGLRFTTLNVPKGSAISTAILTYTCEIAQSGTVCRLKVKGEAHDDAPTFIKDVDAYWARTRTAEGTWEDWDISSAWTKDAEYTSPDIKGIIEEIVNRDGWVANNDLVVFVEEDGADDNARRYAYSWDKDSSKAAKLAIAYSAGAPSYIPRHSGSVGVLMF